MIISSFVASVCTCDESACTRNTLRALDWGAALTFLVLGILSIYGVFHLPMGTTYAFIGAGAVYTAVMVLHETTLCRRQHCH